MSTVYSFFILLLLSTGLLAQPISVGILVNGEENGEGLPHASLQINNNRISTNEAGRVEIILPSPGNYNIHVGYLSFHDTSFEANLIYDTLLIITLKPRSSILTEVKVWADQLNTAEMIMQREVLSSSVTALDVSQLPLIAGEPDIIKPLQFNPGVQGGLPGSSDIYIRGSDQYQNGVMLDGFYVYNLSHAFGYVSAIPPGVSEKLTLHKEAYPIHYGNGAAGYINSNLINASPDKIKGEAGIGIGSIYGSISLPLKKNKSGLVAGGRFSTTGIVFEATDLLGVPIADFIPGYNDMLVKYYNRLSKTKQLEVLGYFASDFIKIDNYLARGKTNIYNGLFGITFRNQPQNKWFSSNKVFISNYRYHQDYIFNSSQNGFNPHDELQYKYDVIHTGWEGIWRKNLFADLSLTLGGELNYNLFLKPEIEIVSKTRPSGFSSPVQNQSGIINPVLFSSFDWKLFPSISFQAGTRLSTFIYANDTKFAILPRLNLTYSPTSVIAFFVAYDRSSQLFHRYRKAAYSAAIDLPVPSSENLPVQFTSQIATGTVFSKANIKVQIQIFYRNMKNTTDRDYYIPTSSYNLNGDIFPSTNPSYGLISVNGQSYGFETALNYTWNILKFNLAYTWSKSFRKSDLLNKGMSYPFEFNNEHTIKANLIARFKQNSLNKIVEIGSSWSYGSGYHTQFPLQFINSPDIPGSNLGVVSYIDKRNNAQLPPIHHLDININFIALKKYGSRIFRISMFNVYFNPLYTAYDYDVQGNLIGQSPLIFVPSLSWSFKFN